MDRMIVGSGWEKMWMKGSGECSSGEEWKRTGYWSVEANTSAISKPVISLICHCELVRCEKKLAKKVQLPLWGITDYENCLMKYCYLGISSYLFSFRFLISLFVIQFWCIESVIHPFLHFFSLDLLFPCFYFLNVISSLDF